MEYDIREINNNFYTDFRMRSFYKEIDLILNDRIIHFYPKEIKICPIGCYYKFFNFNDYLFCCTCEVKIKSNIEYEKDINLSSFKKKLTDIIKYSVD